MKFNEREQMHIRNSYNYMLAVLLISLPNSIQGMEAAVLKEADYDITVDKAVPQRHRYDGDSVCREQTAVRHWKHKINPATIHTDTVRSEDGPIQGHVGRKVIYGAPFRTKNGLIARDQRKNYTGLYQYVRDLGMAETINVGPLFYRPASESAIYYAYITQQQWERTDHVVVDFFVVSYDPHEKIRFIEDAHTAGGKSLNEKLPEAGLYELVDVDNQPCVGDVPAPLVPGAGVPKASFEVASWTNRLEKWKLWLSDGNAPEAEPLVIRAPHGVASVPGVGLFALNGLRAHELDAIEILKKEKEQADKDIDLILHQAGSLDATIVICGPSQCGKTTFINCYAENPCASRKREDGRGWELHFPAPLAGFTVGDGKKSQTTRPAFWHDVKNNLVVCDNPGDDDTNGALRDIINAGMTYRIFKSSPVKLLFAIEEAKIMGSTDMPFLEALETLINSFTNDDHLHKMIHLLITKHDELEINTYLKSLVGDPNATPAKPHDSRLNDKPRLLSLLHYLAAHPERVSTAPRAPKVTGAFIPDLATARASMLTGPVVANPDLKVKIKSTSESMVKDLARRLNDDIATYLRTEGAQKIIEYCLKKIENHNGNAEELRTLFTGLATRLKGIPTRKTAASEILPEDGFLQVFEGVSGTVTTPAVPEIFDAQKMRTIMDDLKFLKNLLPHTVSFNIEKWKDALTSASDYLNTIGKIERLAKKPDVTFENGTLSVKGTFVGASDVEKAIAERNIKQENLKWIIIHALNTWFIEQDMTHNETSIAAIAPRWKVTPGKKTINLNGLSGENGAQGGNGTNGTDTVTATPGVDGQPGKPGHNAGSFFGKLFVPPHYESNLSSLEIKANGGKGGNGGSGGTGGAGKNAGNGVDTQLAETSNSGEVTIIAWGDDPVKASGPYFGHRLYFNVDQRKQYIDKSLQDWIGPKFTDQIWVKGIVRNYEHAPLGDPGMPGGKGGQKGLGGNKGQITIQGSDAIKKEQEDGKPADNSGSAGNGGQGGTNGMVLRGTKWTNCSIHGEVSNPPVDRWHVGPAHDHPAVARANNGSQPTGVLSSTAASSAPAIIALDTAALVKAYHEYFKEKAKDPLMSPFIRVFPGLKP